MIGGSVCDRRLPLGAPEDGVGQRRCRVALQTVGESGASLHGECRQAAHEDDADRNRSGQQSVGEGVTRCEERPCLYSAASHL